MATSSKADEPKPKKSRATTKKAKTVVTAPDLEPISETQKEDGDIDLEGKVKITYV